MDTFTPPPTLSSHPSPTATPARASKELNSIVQLLFEVPFAVSVDVEEEEDEDEEEGPE